MRPDNTLTAVVRLVRQWKVISLCLLAGLASGTTFFVVAPAEYTAYTQLYVSFHTGDNPQTAYQGSLLSQQKVTSYIELIVGERVRSQVSRDLALPIRPGQITADAAAASVLIDVSTTYTDAANAATIANRVADVLPGIVNEVETTSPGGYSPISVRQVYSAATPTGPSSWGSVLCAVIGLIIGGTLGVTAAAFLQSRDRKLRTVEDVQTATGVPLLGVLPQRTSSDMLLTQKDSQHPEAEAYRQLRTSITYIKVDEPPQVLLIASALSCEGRTSVTLNLAFSLAAAGQTVLAVEADLRHPSFAQFLSVPAERGLSTVLLGRGHMGTSVARSVSGSFDVLTAGPPPPNPHHLLASPRMGDFLREARNSYSHILIDTPPAMQFPDATAFARLTDGVIMLTSWNRAEAPQVSKTAQSFGGAGSSLLGAILTGAPLRGRGSYNKYNYLYTHPNDARPDNSARTRGDIPL